MTLLFRMRRRFGARNLLVFFFAMRKLNIHDLVQDETNKQLLTTDEDFQHDCANWYYDNDALFDRMLCHKVP